MIQDEDADSKDFINVLTGLCTREYMLKSVNIKWSLEMSGYAILNAVNTTYKEIPYRYDVLGLDPWWFICVRQARIRRILLDGYDVLREHGRTILESVEHSPLIWPTIEENGVIKTKKYVELSAAKKIQADCDMKAANIILQDLPSDIYSLFNHHRVSKDLWKRIQLLMQGDDPIACFNKAMAFLTAVASLRVTVQQVQGRQDEEQLSFLADPGVPDGQVVQTIIPNYDSDCDDIANEKGVLMANISNYGSDVISEEKANKEHNNKSVTAELERYKERVKTFEQHLNIDLSSHEKMINSRMDDMIKEKIALKEQVDSLEQNLSKQIKKGMFIANIHSFQKLTKDFGKRFTPQQELSDEQAFWLRMSTLTSKPSDAVPIKIEAPKELSKISLVNESLKKLKFHLAKFDNVVKIRTTPNAHTEGKEIIDIAEQKPSASTIVPGMFKLDLEPLAPRLLQNREIHLEYIKNTQEQADILWGIVKQAKSKQPLDNTLDFACNKKNDRISQTTSRNMKNKIEAQPRNVNKKNRVVEPIRNVDVKQSQLNANSKPICATCKKSMFDGVHDMCLLDFVKNVNSRAKSAKKHKFFFWKPTGHVFTEVGFKWKPIGRTFTIIELKVYSKKPKNVKNIGSSKKAKIVESKNANHSEPNHTRGSKATDIPSSSSLVMTGCPYCSLVSGLRMFKTYDREPLSAHEIYDVLGLDPWCFIYEVQTWMRRIFLNGHGVLRQSSFSSLNLGYDRFTPHVSVTLLKIKSSLDSVLYWNNLLSRFVNDLWTSELTIFNLNPADM
uniref:Uncharacterized protein n=1 Tax=Tanacetum cinerariifolium TaxID=118510 RepID=A0A6L2J4L5_TANCI|nr:hypothetical protein [Tanacetum cinerariifolium]